MLFIKICNIHSKTPVLESVLGRSWNEVEGHKVRNFIKKRLQHRFFLCEYCEISNNTCFKEHLCMAASENNKKRFLGKVTVYNDHYMINMGGQRPNIGSNWPLTGPYLQRWCC